MKIYTKTGDSGDTSLADGTRVSKDDFRVEAYGTIDELSAVIALLRDSIDVELLNLTQYRQDLLTILNKLMNLGALISAGERKREGAPTINEQDVERLEERIDQISSQLQPIKQFTIAGGHPLISYSHLCRTVCRRAERRVVSAANNLKIPETAIIYLNRLSDYFYQLGRKLTDEMGVEEEYWNPRG